MSNSVHHAINLRDPKMYTAYGIEEDFSHGNDVLVTHTMAYEHNDPWLTMAIDYPIWAEMGLYPTKVEARAYTKKELKASYSAYRKHYWEMDKSYDEMRSII